MKHKLLFTLPLVFLMASCGTNKVPGPGRAIGDEKHYASYMYNYPRVTSNSASGLDIKSENLMYVQEEITLGQKIIRPTVDPERTNYEFKGWFKEKNCTNEWDFDSDIANNSVILYAKWAVSSSEAYIEPEYVYPEKIITDVNYRVTGILGEPVENNYVALTTGMFARLENSPSDVKFAINYERKADVNLTVATYDTVTGMIHLETNKGDTFDIHTTDKSASLVVDNTTYENKAKGYEENSKAFENYHIVLGGSSSMENWATSTADMDPIVTVNHGIGGTTVTQWEEKLFERLMLPYSPKAVVYYVGVNDIINSHLDGETTGRNLVKLFNKTHNALPNTKIFYVLINKLPGFASSQNDFDIANNAAIEYAKANSYLTCIDAGVGLLKENGKPHHAYFRTDGLHMSQYGYVVWGGAVKKAIIDWLG